MAALFRAVTALSTAHIRLHISTKPRSGAAPGRGMDSVTPLPPYCCAERTRRTAIYSLQNSNLFYGTVLLARVMHYSPPQCPPLALVEVNTIASCLPIAPAWRRAP